MYNTMMPLKKIIHIDMDCFYAAVEIRDNPTLRNKPVAVGGKTKERGVLCTCNYEARRYGLHAAMATAHALRLCPKLILLPVNMEKYRQTSREIHKILKRYTDIIETLSLDEAFLDVSHCQLLHGSATLIGQSLQKQIYSEQNLTASVGVAPNKFLAKVASDWYKPNGFFVIKPEDVAEFIKQLPILKIFGVGPITARKISRLGIKNCEELQKMSLHELLSIFGRFGARLYKLCRGIDDHEVEPKQERKSISVEETYPVDLSTIEKILTKLPQLLDRLNRRLRGNTLEHVNKIFVKIKFYDFTKTTLESSQVTTLNYQTFEPLLRTAYSRFNKPVRLIGLGVRLKNKVKLDSGQLSFELNN